ncbi:RNase H domain-containing protein [Trichonephila clavipes]|nr:RNase H domain-containing protein [Trichonephila clavipes]
MKGPCNILGCMCRRRLHNDTHFGKPILQLLGRKRYRFMMDELSSPLVNESQDYGDNSGHMAREASLHPISEKYMWNDCGLYPASIYSLSSLCALNYINSQNQLIVKAHISLNFLRSRGVQVFFSFVRGYTGIYGNERADWLAKEATKLIDLIPTSIPKSYHKNVFREKIISEWNNVYQISNNALFSKELIPSIQSRLKAKNFQYYFKFTLFLTGHGNLKAYLKRFNLSPTDQCSCSNDTVQNAKHLILA